MREVSNNPTWRSSVHTIGFKMLQQSYILQTPNLSALGDWNPAQIAKAQAQELLACLRFGIEGCGVKPEHGPTCIHRLQKLQQTSSQLSWFCWSGEVTALSVWAGAFTQSQDLEHDPKPALFFASSSAVLPPPSKPAGWFLGTSASISG